MGILRLGHAKLRVLDIDEAVDHYVNTLGLIETGRDDDGTVYLKGWDEWDKYSLILVESDRSGLDHIAFKVESKADLASFAQRVRSSAFEVNVTEYPKDALPFCGRSISFNIPSGHTVYLYDEKDLVGKAVGSLNPEPWPDGLRGAGVHWLDHVMLICEVNPETGHNTVAANVTFFRDVLDFGLSEQVVADTPGGDFQLAAWMFRTTTPHDIAFGAGPTSGLHHLSFFLDEWSDVLKGADILAKRRVQVDVTPQRHGITRGSTTYFFDPSGNRNEMFAGLGYLAQKDMPVITWTAEELWRGIFFHTGVTVENFLAVYT
jgi:catechol 2,3-dioxygenase